LENLPTLITKHSECRIQGIIGLSAKQEFLVMDENDIDHGTGRGSEGPIELAGDVVDQEEGRAIGMLESTTDLTERLSGLEK
jgi:hypothetical protein